MFSSKKLSVLQGNNSEGLTIEKTKQVFTFFWWFAIVIGAAVFIKNYFDFVSTTRLSYNSLTDFHTTYQIALNPVRVDYINPPADPPKPIIKPADGVKNAFFSADRILYFETSSKLPILFSFLKELFYWAMFFLIVHQLKRFADSLSSEVNFSARLFATSKNIGHIFQMAGFITALYYVFHFEREYIISTAKNLFTLENGKVFPIFHYYDENTISLAIFFILFGQLFYTFSFLLKKGLYLQNENDLTV